MPGVNDPGYDQAWVLLPRAWSFFVECSVLVIQLQIYTLCSIDVGDRW